MPQSGIVRSDHGEDDHLEGEAQVERALGRPAAGDHRGDRGAAHALRSRADRAAEASPVRGARPEVPLVPRDLRELSRSDRVPPVRAAALTGPGLPIAGRAV